MDARLGDFDILMMMMMIMIMMMMMALLGTEYVKLQQKCTKLERDLAVVSAQVRLRLIEVVYRMYLKTVNPQFDLINIYIRVVSTGLNMS